MPVNPDDIDLIAARQVEVYKEAELAILGIVRDHLSRGIDAPTWTQDRLAGLGSLRRATLRVLAKLRADRGGRFRAAVSEAYRNGRGSVLTDLGGVTGAAAREATRHVPRLDAIESLSASLIRDVGQRELNVLRHVQDVYREVQAAAVARSIAGGITRREASQAAWQGFVDQGVTSFTDVRGRTWKLSTYVEMAVRTVTMRAAVQGQLDRLEQLGIPLVIVSNESQECPRCRPYEGKVLAATGPFGALEVKSITTGQMITVDVMTTLDIARLAGLMHPNCRHTIRAYLPGATRIPSGPTEQPEEHKARERQREIERKIRKHKEQAEAALTPDAKKDAEAKVRAWQAEMRQHIKDNPTLKRLPYREEIGAGNIHPGGKAPSAAGRLTGPPPPKPTLAGGKPAPKPATGPAKKAVQKTAAPPPKKTPQADEVGTALARALERVTGRKVDVDLAGADAGTAREYADGLLRAQERYPAARLGRVALRDERGGFGATETLDSGASVVYFDRAKTVDRKLFERELAEYRAQGEAMASATDGTWIGAHEFGHVVDEILKGDEWPHRTFSNREATRLVKEQMASEGLDGSSLADRTEYIRRELSGKAASDAGELVSEALADSLINGSAAKPLSKRIVEALDAEYRRLYPAPAKKTTPAKKAAPVKKATRTAPPPPAKTTKAAKKAAPAKAAAKKAAPRKTAPPPPSKAAKTAKKAAPPKAIVAPRRLPDGTPSLGDLFDSAPAGGKLDHQLFAQWLDGQYGGLRVEVKKVTKDSAGLGGDLHVSGVIRDPVTGKSIGQFHRIVARDHNGDLFVEHAILKIHRDHQGSGFQAEFNGALLDWYRQSGVKYVKVGANIDIGGYAWASAGYDFRVEHSALDLFSGLQNRLSEIRGEPLRALGWLDASHMTPSYRWTGPIVIQAKPAPAAAQLRKMFKGASDEEIQRQLRLAQEFMARLGGKTFGAADFPSAYELSQLGRWEGAGKDDVWIGKLVMLGSSWFGILRL